MNHDHDHIRKPEGFVEEKLYVLPEYWMKELEQEELTASLFITDIGYFLTPSIISGNAWKAARRISLSFAKPERAGSS